MKVNKDRMILLAIITSTHGINGHVIVKSFTEPIESLFDLPLLDSLNNKVELTLIKILKNGRSLCKINNSISINTSKQYIKKSLYCLRKDLPNTNDNNIHYIEDLKGMPVLDQNENLLGYISDCMNYGASDIVAIVMKKSSCTEMFPFTKEIFPIITKDHVILKQIDSI
ncbi:ribosome maturation factor RimM [Rickettsia endosymbiont of Cardiosporidium cionae]|uniref:ribosome maturation factor RimM n=1 Tax=Rickettsia endosymbiont of Cardiosporidium cionae TaxID=2777155 RepID=UPI0018962D2C|nr:ribosome maturation factor RimM [Rickettsia endosymbiont of Cardiosporidium cionae]KAF8818995.1 ribosome maturation factor RimM [Rickettsia endosymbiont of Cardiosporidium cionae]